MRLEHFPAILASAAAALLAVIAFGLQFDLAERNGSCQPGALERTAQVSQLR